MLCGTFTYDIDEKGRVLIPRQFRKTLREKQFIICTFPEGCLCLFSRKNWKQLVKSVAKQFLPDLFLDDREEIRKIISSSMEINIEESGKILIPFEFRKYAGLQKMIVFAGCGFYIEIWDIKRWTLNAEILDKELKVEYEEEIIASFDPSLN